MALKYLSGDQELLLLFLLEGCRIRDEGKFVGTVEGLLRNQILAQHTKYAATHPEADVRAVRFRFLSSLGASAWAYFCP